MVCSRESASAAVRPRLAQLVAALIVLLYLAGVSPQWYVTPDSALYLMLGENLAQGAGYTLWGKPHVHVPPGFPLLLAGLELGGGDMLRLNLMMSLLGLATLLACYLTLRQLTAPRLAVLVTLAVAVSHPWHLATLRLLSDMPFTLLVWLGLYCYRRRVPSGALWPEVGTLCLAAGCWTRVAGFALLAGASAGLVLRSFVVPDRARLRTQAGALLLLGAATLAVFYRYHQQATQDEAMPSYGAYLASAAERGSHEWIAIPLAHFGQSGRSLAYLLTGQQHNVLGHTLNLCWLPVIAGMGLHWRRGNYVSLGACAGYLGANLLVVEMIPRYLVPVAPLLMLYFAEGCGWLACRLFASLVGLVRSSGEDIENASVPSSLAPISEPGGRGSRRAEPVACGGSAGASPSQETASRPSRYAALRIAGATAVLIAAVQLPKTIGQVAEIRAPHLQESCAERKALYAAAAFLSERASPPDRFVSSCANRELSYLSGAASLTAMEGRRWQRAPNAGELRWWVEQDVKFVLDSTCLPAAERDRLHVACERAGFELVYENRHWRLFEDKAQRTAPLRISSRAAPFDGYRPWR